MRSSALAILTAVAVGSSAPAMANETAAEHVGHGGRNIFEIFLGGTSADHHGTRENAFSVGAQYRYAFSETVSAGILAEYASDPMNFWVVGIPVVFHVGEGWQFTAMPGAEIENGHSEFLMRAGVGYEFELEGGYALKPEVNFDWVDDEVSVVLGLSVGFRF